MSAQYWVGGFFIDLSRNQITQNKQSQTIAPKALAVLTHLAENQGAVVSHDALLTKVWQDTAVSPNTLQKSIAQLRKALGDNGNLYIKTHAKQGYSLECDVRWHDNAALQRPAAMGSDTKVTHKDNEQADTLDQPESSKSVLRLLPLLAVILIVGIGGILNLSGFISLTSEQPPNFSIGKIRALTSTDNKELASIYTPDGEYVVFHRYSEVFCRNNIWAKNTSTQQEYQLTKNLDAYGTHSFSADGKHLVFVKTGGCEQPVNQKQCYKLMTLDFNQALESPQLPTELLECKNSEIKRPKWLNNNNITLLQKYSDRWKLVSYSMNENSSEIIYGIDDGNLIDYDYSPQDELIALTSTHSDGQYYINMLKPDGQLISSHRIQYPDEIANFRFVYPNFSPLETQLIFSTGRQLFTLSYDGQVTNVSLPLDEPMGSPNFHPDGKRMLVIKGHYDSDIATMPLSQINKDASPAEQNNRYSVVQRSILGEDSALFQPNGEQIAYISGRSGEDQVWIAKGEHSQQLTNFPMDSYVAGMDWAADGESLLVNVVHELTQVFLDGTEKTIKLDYPVEMLFQWDSENQLALLRVRVKGVPKLAKLNLANSRIHIINDKTANWAVKSDKGQLVYTDEMDRFWKPGPVEGQLIEALNDQGSEMRFVIKDEVIYGINKDFQLWSYALNEEKFEIIGNVTNKVDYLTDINQEKVLLTVRVSARKEVAELTLAE